MKVIKFAAAASLVGISTAMAAPNCDAIISHGLRNIEISQSQDAAIAFKYFKHCQKNFNSMSDSEIATAGIEVFGYGSGDGSSSRKRSQEQLEQWCTINKSTAIRNQSSYQQSEIIYQGSVSAWESCNALSSKGLIVDPRITPDRKTVDIGIVYKGDTKSGIILTGIATEGFTCHTVSPLDAKPIRFPSEVNNLNIQTHCIRDSTKVITNNSQDFQVTPRGTISIQSSSDPFQLYFAEEWDPGVPMKIADAIRVQSIKNEIPVGTVIISTMPPEIFFNRNHPQFQENEWVIADGTELPANSAYGRLMGVKVSPDLRYLQNSKLLMDARNATLKQGQNIAEITQASSFDDSVKWTWISSGRDNQGHQINNDYEQGIDQFQNFINESGVVISQGRTLNWKHRIWGAWNAGEATVLGIASKPIGLFHYIKIN
jgi:hypothetical protein